VRKLTIAIDGPSGAGKGTVARAIAAELGYRHVDSGAMYRAVGWKAIHDGVPLDNEHEIAALASRSRLSLVDEVVTIDDHDVTRAIRTPEIDRAAAAVARLPRVRAVLVEQQRHRLRRRHRDGRPRYRTVVFRRDVKVSGRVAGRAWRRRAADPAHTGGPRRCPTSPRSDRARRARSDAPGPPLHAAPDASSSIRRENQSLSCARVLDVVERRLESRSLKSEV
jgi:cytidylate kinase